MQEPARFILLYLVLPAWLLAGLADWACHRRSDLAHTTGPKESLLHMLMIMEVGLGVLAAVFLQITSAVLLLLLVLLAAHALTSHWDLHYASGRRHVGPFEQSVHAYLEGFPLAACVLLVASYWSQFTALFGAGTPDWRWTSKADPLPTPLTLVLLAASALLGFAPYAEELLRSLKAQREKVAPPHRPAPPGV
jgi:UPF0716 family protein affecting phage T7 exclusion